MRGWNRSALLVSSAIVSVAIAAPAAAQTKSFDVPAQSVQSAVTQLGRQADIQIIAARSVTRGARSTPVRGDMTVEQALSMMLRGTGLTFRQTGPQTFTVIAASRSSEAQTTVPSTSSSGGDGASEDIVVTGTNIRGVAPVGSTVRAIGAKEIKRSGFSTTEQLLNSVPQNFKGGAGGASSERLFGNSAQNNYSTGYGVNLRGLGNSATLTLVNGHRIAATGDGFFTDVSNIPVAAIERVEILTDGASAIYGSDAVAGVVNFKLKSDLEGGEVTALWGATTDAGTRVASGSVVMGHVWNTGNFVIYGEGRDQTPLMSEQRSFTSALPGVTILPSQTRATAGGYLRQKVTDRLSITVDGQYTFQSVLQLNRTTVNSSFPTDSTRYYISAGAEYDLGSWLVNYRYDRGREEIDADATTTSFAGVLMTRTLTTLIQRGSAHNVSASGPLFALPGGDVRVALGAARRVEAYDSDIRTATTRTIAHSDRSVKSVFGEVVLPIVGPANAIPGVDRLTLSGAVRYDDYSDFGGTTNYKIGASWRPIPSLELRGAYSTSFRAPSTGRERFRTASGLVGLNINTYNAPSGSGLVPVLVLTGGDPNIRPETANNITAGVAWEPVFARGLRAEVNFFDIRYRDQIYAPVLPASVLNDPRYEALVSKQTNADILQIVAAGSAIGIVPFDNTGGRVGANPLARAEYVVDARTRNLSRTKIRGLDFNLSYTSKIGQDDISLRADVTYIIDLQSEILPGSGVVSLLDTVMNPVDLRARGLATWSHKSLTTSLAVNYVDGYADTSVTPNGQVAAWTTLDFTAGLDMTAPGRGLGDGWRVNLAIFNLFDKKPPYVFAGLSSRAGSHYDPANADGRGRFVQLSLTKAW